MATKVKQAKRWAVRERKTEGGWYWLFVGPKPCKVKRRWPTQEHGWEPECAGTFEWFCPKHYHLKPGGGPVLIKFKEP